MDTVKMQKAIRITAYIIMAAFIATFVALCVAVGTKNGKAKEYRTEIEMQQHVIDSLTESCEALGAMDAITINCTFEVSNKNILSVNTTQANQIAKTFAVLTRQEILDSLNRYGNIR